MSATKKVSRTRAKSYRRRGKTSPCKGKGPAVCRSLSSCKYSSGKKRSFCRRNSNSTRKHRKITRSGKSYGGSRRRKSRRGGSRQRMPAVSGGSRRRKSRRGGSRQSMPPVSGGSRRRRSRRAGSRKRRAGTMGVLSQALVPGGLLFANNYFKSNRSNNRSSRRSRRSRRYRR